MPGFIMSGRTVALKSALTKTPVPDTSWLCPSPQSGDTASLGVYISMAALTQELGKNPAAITDPAEQQVPLTGIQDISGIEQHVSRDVDMFEFVQRVRVGLQPFTDIHDCEFLALVGRERGEIDFHRLDGRIRRVQRM